MLSAEKTALLQSFLGQLPKDVAARLASAVELDRLADGKALPHDVILEGLRPVLRDDSARKRTPTPLRLFCRPFEDLLVNVPRAEKQKGRLLRAHVVPVWHWLSHTVLPAEAEAYSAQVRRLAMMRKYDEALTCAGEFWPVAGEAMAKAIAQNPVAAATAIGGETIAADAAEMALLLKVGCHMLEVQALLPKPTAALSEELLHGLRDIYDKIVEKQLDAGPYVSVVAMRRLFRPWEALKLALVVARQTHDTLISSTDMGLAGDVLFCDMEEARMAIMAVRQPAFDVNALVQQLTAFTNISSAIVKEVEILRQGRWGQRLLRDRAAVGEVMDAFMERAPKEIAGALPVHKAGYKGSSRVPDFSRPPDPERVERGLRYARMLAETKLLAVPGSFGAKHQSTIEEAGLILRSYCEDVLKELRTAEGPRREVVEQQFHLSVELTSLIFDQNEADFLRRRGKAAGARIAA